MIRGAYVVLCVTSMPDCGPEPVCRVPAPSTSRAGLSSPASGGIGHEPRPRRYPDLLHRGIGLHRTLAGWVEGVRQILMDDVDLKARYSR